MSYPWPYRRIATEEAFSVPEVYEALRGWAATAHPAEPDQDFRDFVFTQDTPGLRRVRRQLLDYPYQTTEGAVRFLDEAEISDEDRRKIYHRNAERIFGIPDGDEAGERG